MIAGRQSHHDDVLCVLDVRLGVDELHHLVVDDACIRVVDGAVATDQQLWVLVLAELGCLGLEEFTELGVRIDNIGDT